MQNIRIIKKDDIISNKNYINQKIIYILDYIFKKYNKH
jgi:hypothetical protein